MFRQIYTTSCPNRKTIKDEKDGTRKWACNWNGTPYMNSYECFIECCCPNCGYTWIVDYYERNYGGGTIKNELPKDDEGDEEGGDGIGGGSPNGSVNSGGIQS